jgi:VWFA-related protein
MTPRRWPVSLTTTTNATNTKVTKITKGYTNTRGRATKAGEAVFVLFAIFALMAAIAARQAPTTSRQPFRAAANLVRVDVYPTADGVPVRDLTKDDFQIFEDGKPQTIDAFEHVEIAPLSLNAPAPIPQSAAASRSLAAGDRARIVVLFLDTYHTDAGAARAIRTPLVQFLDRTLGPDDVIAVMTPEMSVLDLSFSRRTDSVDRLLARAEQWGRRDQAAGRDPEEERYERCFPEGGTQACGDPTDPDRDRRRPVVDVAPYRGIARALVTRRREERVITSLSALVRALRTLNDGRKAVIAVSSGWQLPKQDTALERVGRCDEAPRPRRPGTGPDGRLSDDPDRDRRGIAPSQCDVERIHLARLDLEYDFRQLINDANRANVSFYPIDPRGLRALDTIAGPNRPDSPAQEAGAGRTRTSSLQTLAEGTDGLAVVNTNNLDDGLARLSADLTSYYLLSYYSTNTAADGGYRRIDVSVKRRGVQVRARRGYRAISASELSAARTEALAAGQTVGTAVSAVEAAIGALAQTKPGVPLRTRVAYSRIAQQRLRMFAVAELDPLVAREGGWLGGGEVELTVAASDNRALATAREALAPGRRAVMVDLGEVAVPDGEVALRTQLRPLNGTGTLQDAVRLLSPGGPDDPGVPLLLRRGPTTGVQFVATADPMFRRTDRIRLQMLVSDPGAVVTAALLDRVGKAIPLPVATTVRADGNSTWAVSDLMLAPLTLGDYALRMTVTEAGKPRETVTAFRIVG